MAIEKMKKLRLLAVRDQKKVLLRKQSPKLSADKIDKLRKLLGEEPAEKVG